VLVGHHRRDLVGGERQPLAFELLRTDDVDTVWFAVDMLIDPGELVFELLGAVRRRPQHAEAARVGDRSHHVATVAERQ
jgi:hypothetical protein